MKITVKRLSKNIPDRSDVKKYFKEFKWDQNQRGRVHRFYTIEKYYGKYITRHYAIRVEGKTKEEKHLLEYLRHSQDGVMISRNLYFGYLSGYTVKFPHERRTYRAYNYGLENFSEVYSSLNVWPGELITDVDALLKNDEKLKYCVYDGNVPFIEFINTYNEFPGMEALGKIGLSWLGAYKTLWKLEGKKKKQVIKYIFEHANDIKEQRWNFKLSALMREVFPELKTKYLEAKAKREGLKIKKLQAKEKEKAKAKENFQRMLNEALEELNKSFNKKNTHASEYTYKVPASLNEITVVGEKLGHCYKKSSAYLRNHITGNALLVFIYNENQKPIAAAEVIDNKIRQLRGNQNKVVDDPVIKEEVELMIDIKKELMEKISEVSNSIGDINKAVQVVYQEEL